MRRTRFVTWAKKDPDDTTPIIYTFKTKEDDGTEKVLHFTSDDILSYSMMERVRAAWIEKIERGTNGFEDVWIVTIYED